MKLTIRTVANTTPPTISPTSNPREWRSPSTAVGEGGGGDAPKAVVDDVDIDVDVDVVMTDPARVGTSWVFAIVCPHYFDTAGQCNERPNCR
jgi:hypothetical protein